MMDRRISPPRDLEEVLDLLTEPSVPGLPPLFQSKQKAMMFAAALGHSLGERLPLEKKGTAIRLDIFQKALDDGYMDSLAVAETGQLQVLGSTQDEQRATIFEEYAHRGLVEMKRRCYTEAGDQLRVLLGLTDDARNPSDMEVTGIDPSILRGLVT
jgi:dnd system-associated protein 4